MSEYWESKFRETSTMWGYEHADSAIQICRLFKEKNIRNILIPGVGYGRNAGVFIENGIKVTGIEIAQSAIHLTRKNGLNFKIHHGSVTQMPFDHKKFDGVFCYALVHLLSQKERKAFIQNCYNQLKPGGIMVFVAVSKKADMYGRGRYISSNRYELMRGLSVYFYDADSATKEF